MPIISFEYNDLISLIGKDIKIPELVSKIPMLGADIASVEGTTFNVEFFPNRPDLYSVEGIARALRTFLGIESGMKKYHIQPSGEELIIDPSVEGVRPYMVAGIVRDVVFDEHLIQSVMNIQEKLHLTLGRGRKKVAIGIHDLDTINAPFTYKAVPPTSVRFEPLGETREMDLESILKYHPKGMAYAHIVEGSPLYPLLVDRDDNVLSFPPVINGTLTMVREGTTNLLLDLTGTDLESLGRCLNIFATLFAERGGKLYSVDVKYKDREMTTPDLRPEHMDLEPAYVNKILGLQLSPGDIVAHLGKMGFSAEAGKPVKVAIPPYRADILHPIDIVEDIGIAYGYDKFQGVLPREMTFSSTRAIEIFSDSVRRLMIGLGYTEIVTLTLSNKQDEFLLMRMGEDAGGMAGIATEMINPLGEEHTILRTWLIPSLLKILKSNRHRDLPQLIFEVGDVVLEHENKRRLAALGIHSKASFTEIKSAAEAVLKDIGVAGYELKPKRHNAFIYGRCAAIVRHGKELGFFGELHPEVITNFALGNPVVAFELNLEEARP